MPQKMFLTNIYHFFKADGDLFETKILIKQPIIPIFISIAYVILVKWLLPRIMENRKPLKLKRAIIVYNLLICLLSGYLAYKAIRFTNKAWKNRCDVKIVPKHIIQRGLYIMQYFWTAQYLQVLNRKGFQLLWYIWMTKYLELLDTVFLSLRKKNRRITFLHLFRHFAMVLVFALVFYMKTAAIGLRVKKYLRWKKYLTLLQIMQFIIILTYGAYGFATGCERPEKAELGLFICIFIILVMFINYSKKSHSTISFLKQKT
ncbi:very long chain fatty acid elongase 7 isoform X3 [Parasteatoda tepidariorum]|uniref:very long chain fatty acid elongase 7 isoform X3 n=1 Tax=Parasteatoda tepidariorum TaxID=114398 RepID=UPI001C719A21|nr:elongation of very long chain fatty acids protein 7 isoform X3 [Parasteatoda tepidariorum]